MLKTLPIVLALVYLLGMPALLRAEQESGLLALMTGEFALQEGRFAEAAQAYVEAAQHSNDPQLAERAARVALLAEDAELSQVALQRWLKLAPDALGARQLTAVLALREGRQAAALGALRGLLRVDGDEGWRLALQALVSERRSPVLAEVVDKLISADDVPPGIEPTLGFGGLAQRLDLDTAVMTMAVRATERHPELPRPWLWRAEIERQNDDSKAARASLQRALDLPGLDEGLRLSAAAMLDQFDESLAAARLLAEGEQTDATLAGRAAYLARAEATDELEALYVELQRGDAVLPPARLYLLGQLAELRKQPQEALDWYRQVKDPSLFDQAQLRIALVHDEAGDLDAALAGLHAYQKSDSENGEALVNAYLLEAELLQRRKRHEEALAVYERALAVFEDDPELLYARALGMEKLGRVDEAIADLRRLHAMDPDNADTLNALGYTLADRTDKLDEALDLIERALSMKPDNPAIVDSMGWVLFRLGRVDEALVELRRAFKLQRDAEVAAHLGEALWVAGQREEAQEIFRIGQEIDPENVVLRRTLERLLP